MTGLLIMASALAAVGLVVGLAYVLSLLLPEAHPLRQRIRVAAAWVYKNPRTVEKRLRQIAFALIVGYFIVLTIVYS
ncbi:hypothetical protein ACQ86G_19150 [Roseateles chitinivorans]|uniref:hypothetical protein n=1 Tax=Roseateles chitinivorans TaxID=2917965 RepID=UPI003D667C83